MVVVALVVVCILGFSLEDGNSQGLGDTSSSCAHFLLPCSFTRRYLVQGSSEALVELRTNPRSTTSQMSQVSLLTSLETVLGHGNSC